MEARAGMGKRGSVTDDPTGPADSPSNTRLRLALGILAGLALAGVVLTFSKGCDGGGDTPRKPPLSVEQIQRFKVGDIYRTIVNTSVHGPVEGKKWGIKGIGTLVYQGELCVVREVVEPVWEGVETDPDTEVKIRLDVIKARDLALLTLEDVKLDLPPTVGNLLTFAAESLTLPALGDPLSITVAILKRDWVRGALIDAIEAVGGGSGAEWIFPKPPSIGDIEGRGAKYLYRGGHGMMKFETDGSLSREQEERFEEFSVFAESRILPAPGDDGPEEWDLDVRDIAHLLVPASSIEVEGNLRFARREKEGSVVRIECIRGTVYFVGSGEGSETLGNWEARGSLYYDEASNSLTKGELSGEVHLDKRSTDHILFEAQWKGEPEYRVLIWGDRPGTREEAAEEVAPFEIEF